LLFTFALEYAISRAQVKQDGLKLHVTHHLLVYVYDVSVMGRSVYTVKKNALVLVVASKEIGLEVNADKTKYLVMSRNHNAGRWHSKKD
jgi:hypothetical protein